MKWTYECATADYKQLYEAKCRELDIKNNELTSVYQELKFLKSLVEEIHTDLTKYIEEEQAKNKPKGYLCHVNGNKYEKIIYDLVQVCQINNQLFNTQKASELGGSSSLNDLVCNYKTIGDICIEIKKSNAPDWMQCSIKHNEKTNSWEGSKKGKIPSKSREIFDILINKLNLYDGEIPPFMKRQITHEEWLKIKKETDKWNDQYIDIPNDTIRKMYRAKGCQYIQINDGYGLYHLGEDVCNFGVPLFEIPSQLRIRTKVHNRQTKAGFCTLSVTAACQPKNIKLLTPSPYSLDNKDKLPPSLIYLDKQ